MDTNWILVIVLWGGLVGVIIACFLPEFRKTPDQRKVEVQKARESAIKKREEKKKSRQEAKNNAPAVFNLNSPSTYSPARIVDRTFVNPFSSLIFSIGS